MTTEKIFTGLAGITVVIIVAALAISGLNAQPLAPTRVLYVKGTTGVNTATCGTAASPCKTIQYTINKAPAETQINVAAGTYTENLTIEKNKIWLKGAGASTTVIASPSIENNTIQLYGASNIGLQGFTIKGGRAGIYGHSSTIWAQLLNLQNNSNGIEIAANSTLSIRTMTAKYNGMAVIIMDNSYGDLDNCNIINNSGSGISFYNNSFGRIKNCIISNNSLHGISLVRGSSAEMTGNTISNHVMFGLWASQNCSAEMTGNKIFNNKWSGVSLEQNSNGNLRGANQIYANGDPLNFKWGIAVFHDSQLTIGLHNNPGIAKDDISGNYGAGITLGHNSDLWLVSGNVHGNKNDGIMLRADSSSNFENGASIYSNTGMGIRCADLASGASRKIGAPGICTGNTLGCTNCLNY